MTRARTNPKCATASRRPATPGPRLKVDVIRDAGAWTAFGDVEASVAAASGALAAHPAITATGQGEVCLALSDDAAVAALNGTWRGKAKPTNVLSFPAPPGTAGTSGDTTFLGDIVLAEETLLREAAELGIAPVHHLQHLVVHGLLHLLGYDHVADGEAARMEAIETETLAALGIADPYTQID